MQGQIGRAVSLGSIRCCLELERCCTYHAVWADTVGAHENVRTHPASALTELCGASTSETGVRELTALVRRRDLGTHGAHINMNTRAEVRAHEQRL